MISQAQETLKQKERKARTSLLKARRREQVIMKTEMGTKMKVSGQFKIENCKGSRTHEAEDVAPVV